MARTFVPSEQLNFRSAATGTHLLDTYLEACEKGGVTLPILMENLYSSDGGLNPNALQFRVSTSSGTPVFQARFGHFTDADAGWFDTNQSFFHWRGDYATSTAYKRLDMVRLASNQSTYICTVAHTSTSTLDTSKFQEFFDGANITSVVGSLTNINAVAGSLAAINTLAPKTSQLDLLGTSDAVAALTNVSGISGNVTTVAGISSSVTSAATNSTSISSVAGIASNVTAVAGIASNVTALAGKTTEITGLGTSANITNMATLGASGVVGNIATVAGVASTMSAAATNATNAATSASAAGGSATAAANSAAAAATALDTFDDRYLGSKSSEPSVDNDGNALVSGSLFFDSAVGSMKVFDGGNWILATSAGAASLLDYEYTATSGQTTFSGADNNSATLSYAVGNLIVTLNGIVLDNGSDYTATSGTSIVLASGAALNDHLAVVAFKSFTVADTVPASTGGTFAGGVTVSGKVQATDDMRLVAAPSTTRRLNSFVANNTYNLGLSGGSAIAFHRTSDTSDEIGFETHKHGNSHAERFRIGSLGQFGVGGANYGTSGQVLTSAGSGAAPSWASPAVGFAHTLNSGNPAYNSNPAAVGHMWVNTTSGETFICINATNNDNVWVSTGVGATANIAAFSATGGTITTSGGYTIHTFLSSANFVVTGGTAKNMEYLIVAGGGGGGQNGGGGGGAGGLLTNVGGTALSVSSGTHSIVIGEGGANSAEGSNSSALSLTAIGGGGGGSNVLGNAGNGGSGGGAAFIHTNSNGAAGTGTAGQGNNGGSVSWTNTSNHASAGGGGAGAVGQTPSSAAGPSGNGGVGVQVNINGTNHYWAGGGGGGIHGSNEAGDGGLGGGGGGSVGFGSNQGDGGGSALNSGGNGTTFTGGAGGANTGGGGGGGSQNSNHGGAGGSGIVIIRYLT